MSVLAKYTNIGKVYFTMTRKGSAPSVQTNFIEAGPEDRLCVLDGIRERMKQENLSPLENFVMQKAIALFLLSERVGWSELCGRVTYDGLAELPSLKISDDHNKDEVVQAIESLERRGLLHLAEEEESSGLTMRIATLRDGQRALVRSVYQFERKHSREKGGN